MTEKLREELARIGDASPRVAVPADVWARGRRARRRDRLVAGAAVLSIVVMLSGLGLALGLPGREDAPPVSGDDIGAVPSVIHGVPQRFTDFTEDQKGSWDRDLAETDLAIGRASVAFTMGEGWSAPAAITARDGVYHLLELPGWIGTGIGAASEGAALALSPDGRQLAYPWWDPAAPASVPMPSGVRVVDLEEGKIRTVALTGGDGVIVSTLTWSPDSRWLAWQGREQRKWTAERTNAGPNSERAGVIARDGTVSTPIPMPRATVAIAVDNRGRVMLTNNTGWTVRDDDLVERGFSRAADDENLLSSEGLAGALSEAGTFAARTGFPLPSATFLSFDAHRHPPGRDSRILVSRELPADRYPEGATVEPLGWINDDHVVALVTGASGVSDGGWTNEAESIVVMSAPWAAEETFRSVVTFNDRYEETGGINDISVAVDLMTLEEPTRDFPEPEWPWSDERKWGTAALVVVPLVLLALVLRQRRRNRRLV